MSEESDRELEQFVREVEAAARRTLGPKNLQALPYILVGRAVRSLMPAMTRSQAQDHLAEFLTKPRGNVDPRSAD